jgi:hypothetical protein
MIGLAAYTPFMITFMNKLKSCKRLSTALFARTFFEVVPHIKESFDLLRWDLEALEGRVYGEIKLTEHGTKCSDPLHLVPIEGKQLAEFIISCHNFGLVPSASSILEKVLDDLYQFHPSDLKVMMLPLLESISASLPSQISTSPLYKRLFRETIMWYLNIYLDPEPSRPYKWIRSRALCPKVIKMLQESDMMAGWPDECSDLQKLNEFLVSHDRRTLTMKVDMDVKDHLHSAFVLGKPDCELKMIPGDDGYQFIVTKGTKMYVNQYSA